MQVMKRRRMAQVCARQSFARALGVLRRVGYHGQPRALRARGFLVAAMKAVGDGEESFVLFVGSKQSGKSSLVSQFLNPSKEVWLRLATPLPPRGHSLHAPSMFAGNAEAHCRFGVHVRPQEQHSYKRKRHRAHLGAWYACRLGPAVPVQSLIGTCIVLQVVACC
jgi:hypothetical protein